MKKSNDFMAEDFHKCFVDPPPSAKGLPNGFVELQRVSFLNSDNLAFDNDVPAPDDREILVTNSPFGSTAADPEKDQIPPPRF